MSVRATASETGRERGFTLVEIMVTLLIGAFVIAGLYQSFNTLHKWWIATGVTADQRQNARAGLEAVTRDLEMAGYRVNTYGDPNKAGIAVTLAAADRIEVDGQRPTAATLADEHPVYEPRLVFYHLATDVRTNTQNLYRQIRTQPGLAAPDEIVAENVSAFSLAYYDKDDNPVAGLPPASALGSAAYLSGVAVPAISPLRQIRRIQVSLTTRAGRALPIGPASRDYTVTASVTPANLATADEIAADVTAPGVPAGLTVVDTGICDSKLHVRWNRNTELDLAGYVLFYGTTETVTVPVGSVAGQATPTVLLRPSDLLITKNQNRTSAPNTYAVQIAAYDSSGNHSGRSAAVSANPDPDVRVFGSGDDTTVNPAKPSPPTAVAVTPGVPSELTVAWAAPADETATVGYRLYRSIAAFPGGHIDGSLQIADESVLRAGTTTWTDTGLEACTTYHYAVASVNCDETLVATYLHDDSDPTLSDYAAGSGTTADPTRPPAPGLAGSQPISQCALVALENPVEEVCPDFDRTEIYWSKAPEAAPSLDEATGVVSGGTHVPDTDAGSAGVFTKRGSQVVEFDSETWADPAEPSLDAGGTYFVLAYSHDRCGNVSPPTLQTFHIPAATESCLDDPLGPPPGSPTGATYLSCAESSVKLGWSYPPKDYTGEPGSGPLERVSDFAGYLIERGGTRLNDKPTLQESWTDAGLESGGEYRYTVYAVDCSGNRSGGLSIGPIRPGALRRYEAPSGSDELAAENFVTSVSDVPSDFTYHNNVKFYLQNTSRGVMTITKMAVAWSNAGVVLDRVDIGGGPGATPQAAVSAGAAVSGTEFAVNAAIEDVSTGAGSPSVAVPVTLRFTTPEGAVNRLADMRGASVAVSLWVRNESLQNDECSAEPVTVSVPRGPVLGGFAQDAPGQYGIDAYEVVGSSGTARDDDIKVGSGVAVNVFGTVIDQSGSLFGDGAGRGFATRKLVGVTADVADLAAVPAMPSTGGTGFERTLYNTGGDRYAIYRTSPTTDGAKMPVVSGKVNWYYALAVDNTGNWDRMPPPDNGAYAYYQMPTDVCPGTPQPPVITLASISATQAEITWTAPTAYEDGSAIAPSDPLTYDVYVETSGSGPWLPPPAVEGTTALSHTHDADMLTATYYYMVRAKNSCSPPRVSADSNVVLGCSGASAVDCALFSVPAGAALSEPFTMSVSSICAFRGNGVVDTVVFRVVSGGVTTDFTVAESSGDQGLFSKTISAVASGAGGDNVLATSGSLTVNLVVAGATPCAPRTVTITGGACSTTPRPPTSLSITAASSWRGSSAVLAWVRPNYNTDGSPLSDLAGYQIDMAQCSSWDRRSSSCSRWSSWQSATLNAPAAQAYTWGGLADGERYKFRVRAMDNCATPNYSAWTPEFLIQIQ